MATKFNDQEKNKILLLNSQGISNCLIGKQLNVDRKVIERFLKKNKKYSKYRISRKLNKKQIQIAQKEYSKGKSATSIAKKLKKSTSFVIEELNKINIFDKNRKYPHTNRKYKCNHSFFKTINTEEKAYWLGFIAADGNIFEKGYTHLLSIGIQTRDKRMLYKFKKSIQSNHPIHDRKRISINGNKVFISTISIQSKEIASDLISNGITPKKSLTINFNEITKNIQEGLQHHFVRGYFDGDGCVSVHKNQLRFSFVSGSKNMIEELQKFFEKKCNLNKVKISTSKNNKYFIFKYGGNLNATKIYQLLYSNANIFLKRKKDKASKIISCL